MKRVTDYFKKLTSNKNQNGQTTSETASVQSTPTPSTSSSMDVTVGNQTDSAITSNDTHTNDRCNDLGTRGSGPVQPKLVSYPFTAFGKQNRSFSKAYFDQYPWLEYSISNDAAFCYVCRMFGSNLSSSEVVYTKSGFQNWKKSKEKFDKHEKCESHLLSWEKHLMDKQSREKGSVMTLLSSAHKDEVERNKLYIGKIIEIIIFLANQGLALRGHDEKEDSDNRGNFLELCNFYARHDSSFKDGFEKSVSFCSKSIQNEIIHIISSMVNEKIVSEVKSCGFFSVMVDEARSYKDQQLSLCIRYVDNTLTPHERFLMFQNCSNDRNAEELALLMLTTFEELGISNLPIIAQTYDGASVMSGKNAGLQTVIRRRHPAAVYVHCYAHKAALAVTDMCKSVESSNILFNGLQALYVHFSKPSHHEVLKKVTDIIQTGQGLKKCPVEISAQSTTRWTCRYKNCEQLINNYDVITEALRFEIDKNENMDAVEAVGILSTITKGNFVVNLFVFHQVLTLTHILSQQLQHSEGTLGGASQVIKATINSLKEKRSEAEFSKIWTKITEFAENHDISLDNIKSSKRKRGMSVILRDSAVMSTIGAGEDVSPNEDEEGVKRYWRTHVYFKVLDVITERLNERFNEESLELAEAVDALFDLSYEKSRVFLKHYDGILRVDTTLLEAEMTVANNLLKYKSLEHQKLSENRKVISSRVKFEELREIVKEENFPNLFQTIKLAASIPISSASCERSFSAMRRIKTWLRTSMLQERFSNLSLLYIEKKILREHIQIKDIVERFAMKKRKLHLT